MSRHHSRKPVMAILSAAVAVVLVCLTASVAPASPAGPGPGPGRLRVGPAQIVGQQTLSDGPLSNVKSTNWAGYVDKGHTFNLVRGSWTVPRVTCTAAESLATFWVGIDGYHAKNVEQAGTLAHCLDGNVSYATWWEMYPAGAAHLVGKTVDPGDEVTASVSVSGHTYTLTVVDHTSPSNSFTRKASCSSCRNASAEWIAERPQRDSGLYPLAKFGHLAFHGSRVGVGSVRGPISKYTHDSLTMINSGGATMARVSPLQSGGNRFVATWLRMQ